MLAANYPLLDVIWSMFVFFIFIAWLMLLFRVFGDIFRSRDMGGGSKALWSIFVIMVPFLGVFVYLIARGHSMQDRDVAAAQQNKEAFDSYVRETVATGGGTADEIAKLADLKAQGALTDAEFEQQKAKLLA